MHRAALLNRLHVYQPDDAGEQAMRTQILEFVRRHAGCFERSCAPGHITGSAWIVNLSRTRVLLTHHRKLDRWLQLGGHSDGDPDTLNVALREAREESGLAAIAPLTGDIFDIDVHPIPARGAEPAHLHYDIRFLLEADSAAPLVVSSESKDLAWVALEQVEGYAAERSILRMLEKTRRL